MAECIFCQIISGKLPSQKLFEDDTLVVLRDIHPKAPVHLLVIPKVHHPMSIADMEENHQTLIGQMVWRAKLMAEAEGIAAEGYRLVYNVRQQGGQEVDHLHLHVLGGEPLGALV